MIRWWVLVFIVLAAGCSMNNERGNTINKYYDINGLIDEQVKLLDSISPVLLKQATIDHQQNLQKITPNDSTWEDEFSIFRTLDLNKPMLIDSYEKVELSHESEKSVTFISKFPDETLVDTLVVEFFDNQSPKRIYAAVSSKNTLFISAKKMEMLFTQTPGINLLHRYKIFGRQKMTTKDSTSFEINAEIKY